MSVRPAPTEGDTLRAFQFCRRATPGDNFYKHVPCEQCTAIAEYGLQERKRALELLVEDFQRLGAVINALKIADVIRMIHAHRDHGPVMSVTERPPGNGEKP